MTLDSIPCPYCGELFYLFDLHKGYNVVVCSHEADSVYNPHRGCLKTFTIYCTLKADNVYKMEEVQ